MVLKLSKYTSPNSVYKKIDFFYSPDMKEDMELYDEMDLDIASWRLVEKFIEKNPAHERIIKAYGKKNKLEGIAILAAHGEKKKGKWFYFIENETKSMQGWINKIDGNYNAIILYLCNPGREEIKSEKTPVLAPNEVFSFGLLNQDKVQVDLFLPGSGYLDTYNLEEELKKLEE